jgi:Holliday junction resolvasome RuvABC ATP-dependent DNA helicase subunit
LLNVEIEPPAREIARRSRGTPRIANNLLRRVRDYAQVRARRPHHRRRRRPRAGHAGD